MYPYLLGRMEVTKPQQAGNVLEDREADAVLLARELLLNPYWPIHDTAEMVDGAPVWPGQYTRAAESRRSFDSYMGRLLIA